MSGVSYPSPLTTLRSPVLEDNMGVSAEVSSQSPPPEHVDIYPSRNLQASMTIEAAYGRLLQRRRNLRELTEAYSSQDTQMRGFERSEFSPGHQAITLTGGQGNAIASAEVDDSEISRENASSPTRRSESMPMLEVHDEDRASMRDLEPSNISGPLPFSPATITHLPPLSPSNNPYRSPSHLHPRRSQFDNQLARRRELLHNDPTTTIGRRVAAREALSRTGRALPESSTPPWDGTPNRIVTTIERDIEQFRAATRSRHTEPPREVTPIDTAPRGGRSLDLDVVRGGVRNQTFQS